MALLCPSLTLITGWIPYCPRVVFNLFDRYISCTLSPKISPFPINKHITYKYMYWSRRPEESVIFCRWLCLSVCLSVTDKFQIDSSFLFLDGIEPFWSSVLRVALYKTLFFDFWFTPPNAQNLLPKICTKLPISRLVWQIDQRCLGLLGGFRGWPIEWSHAKCCGATLVAMATTFGLGAEI